MGLVEGQGYTMHDATGRYLNFGVLGVIAGGVVLRCRWASLHNRFLKESKYRWHIPHFFIPLAFSSFTSFIPTLLCSGPEARNGLFLERLLISLFVLTLASVRLVKIANPPPLATAQRRSETLSGREPADENRPSVQRVPAIIR